MHIILLVGRVCYIPASF